MWWADMFLVVWKVGEWLWKDVAISEDSAFWIEWKVGEWLWKDVAISEDSAFLTVWKVGEWLWKDVAISEDSAFWIEWKVGEWLWKDVGIWFPTLWRIATSGTECPVTQQHIPKEQKHQPHQCNIKMCVVIAVCKLLFNASYFLGSSVSVRAGVQQ